MNIMVGEVEELTDNLCAFVRLRDTNGLGNITEVDLPTRFMFILLVPKAHLEPAIEAGRCMGALMTDEVIYCWRFPRKNDHLLHPFLLYVTTSIYIYLPVRVSNNISISDGVYVVKTTAINKWSRIWLPFNKYQNIQPRILEGLF